MSARDATQKVASWKFGNESADHRNKSLFADMMKHPHIVDVCDLGAQLFGTSTKYACPPWFFVTAVLNPFLHPHLGGSRLAYEWTGFMLLANNILLIGFHVFTGARIIQTLDDGKHCTVM